MDLMTSAQLLGNLGEFVGAVGVVATLIYLALQVRHSSSLVEMNNAALRQNTELAKAEAMDRYNAAVSRWRGRLIEDPELARLWDDLFDAPNPGLRILEAHGLSRIDAARVQNLWIDWINTYRGNYRRASLMGDAGLMYQSVVSVVGQLTRSPLLRELWQQGRTFQARASSDFVAAVEAELSVRSRNPSSDPR